MKLITLDFESFYAKDHSLSKLTYDEYINSNKFEVIGVGVQIDAGTPKWFSGDYEQTKRALQSLDLENSALLAHNAMFDAAILAFHYGIYPKVIFDTLSMARAVHGAVVGGSLKKLSEHYGIGVKGEEVHNFIGYNRKDFTSDELTSYAAYCKQDVNLTYQLFQKLLPHFNKTELKLIDMTIKMYTQPALRYDRDVLVKHLEDVKARQQKFLDDLGLTATDLRSNPKFADLLRSQGVEPPMKLNSKGVDTYAFAKTDEGLNELLEHENPNVQALVSARLGVKTSIETTRTENLIATGDRCEGMIPIGLHYYGARSGRWSATQNLNLQNIPRTSEIKRGLVAPPNHVIVGLDLSNIELRVGLWLAGQMDKLKLLQEGVDLYKDFASNVFNVPYDDVTKDQRFIGKTCIAEGEMVLTKRGLVPIENILLDDYLWDGVEWVRHDGLVYMGEKDVITYQGLTATPDHNVYLQNGERCEFAKAAEKNYYISETGNAGLPVFGTHSSEFRSSAFDKEETPASKGSVFLWGGEVGFLRQFSGWKINKMQTLCAEKKAQRFWSSIGGEWTYKETAETRKCYEATLPKHKRPELLELRRARGRVQIQQCKNLCGVFTDLAELLRKLINRQGRQQWSLRSGELSFCYAEGANKQPQEYSICSVGRETAAIGGVEGKPIPSEQDNIRVHNARHDGGADNSESTGISVKQMQGLGSPKKKARVYDIVNAGPRHRFTVSNLLVSNCNLSLIYGVGSGQLRKALKSGANIDIGEVEAKRIVSLYREEYSGVVSMWKAGGDALRAMLNDTVMHYGYNDCCFVDGARGVRLPSELYLQFPNLRYEYNDGKKELRYDKTPRITDRMYDPKLYQNVIQSLARCVLGEAMVRIHDVYPLALTVHDAIYAVVHESQAQAAYEFMLGELTKAPEWLPGIVLAAEGGFGKSLKDV